MLTIKHITPSNEEFVYPTTHVNFVPQDAKAAVTGFDSLWRYDNDGRAHEIVDGVAYVMNESGKTVARYHLNGPVAPRGEIIEGFGG